VGLLYLHVQYFVQLALFINVKNIQLRNDNESHFTEIYWITLEKTYEDRTPFMRKFISNLKLPAPWVTLNALHLPTR
jgi:hypothetical protein